MTRQRLIFLTATTAISGALAFGAERARDVPDVATGFFAGILCSSAFVSGLDPERVFDETVDAMPGVNLIGWALHPDVNRTRRDVTVTLLGLARSHAVYRDGYGCALDHGGSTAELAPLPDDGKAVPASLPDIAGPALVAAASPELEAALDRAFNEPHAPTYRRTKAVVVVKDGKIVGERYANGYAIDTPVLGFSATKSIISALIGILVRQGKLRLDGPAPVAAWRDVSDPHHVITVDQLLRHTAGLAIGGSLNASLAAALEPVNRMKFAEPDMAAYAESLPLSTNPGSAWNYNDGNYVILSQLIREAVGGDAADVLRFARRELFEPLGIRNVTLEFDASGNPEGSSQMLASARDWARFGLLYLDDGVVGGKRILPDGWVRYSASPTPDAWVGYGAGFWTNQGDSLAGNYRVTHGWPRDAFMAKGTIGQYVIVIPSQRLVIVRLGISPNWPDIDGVSQLVSDVIAATSGAAKSASN